ncbi:Mob1/phocein [Lojkania enalia]|uniref:Mob1/phocein n=1 Tax=Lojkania enalia TaxID=147567 RepID=A0A9P4K873_9PLEO|nr:Mob1/phocein [Didymosphaeria enalia]
MASFFSSVRQGFGGRSNKGNQQGKGNGQGTPSPTAPYSPSPTSTHSPGVPPIPQSPALSSAMSFEAQQGAESAVSSSSRRPPFFFREEYAGLIVKGNFMTLAAKPKLVEEGEWMAHQVVEQYRLLEQMIDIIKVIDERTGRPICNPDVCPTMSASGHTYTWLDNNKKPIKIPAIQYINLVQKWIVGKINDPSIFPTESPAANATTYASGSLTPISTPQPLGPTNLNAPLSQLSGREWLGKTSGFPESFESDIKSIYRQMMRCYAHIYHGHWLEPFWNVNAYKELNTCFIHFINVGKLFGLLGDKEIEPMQPLVDLWLGMGLLPSAPQTQQKENAPTGSSQQPTLTS